MGERCGYGGTLGLWGNVGVMRERWGYEGTLGL